jgi:uncharacterized membrane protein YgcG
MRDPFNHSQPHPVARTAEAPTSPRIPVRPLYSIAELARATRIGRGRLRRMLDERGVELFFVRGRPCVPLSEIVAKLKPLWDSVQASEALRGEGGEGGEGGDGGEGGEGGDGGEGGSDVDCFE